MDAPKCKVCGVAEWAHLCGGAAPSEIERRATVTKPRVTKIALIKVTGARGRPKLGEQPLSAAEKMRRYRARKAGTTKGVTP